MNIISDHNNEHGIDHTLHLNPQKAIRRRYFPLWATLKATGTVTINCPRAAMERIIKAVIKEKYMDEDFKDTNSRLVITKSLGDPSTGSPDFKDQPKAQITFELIKRTTVWDL